MIVFVALNVGVPSLGFRYFRDFELVSANLQLQAAPELIHHLASDGVDTCVDARKMPSQLTSTSDNVVDGEKVFSEVKKSGLRILEHLQTCGIGLTTCSSLVQ